jgi:hypothetical protein
VERQWKQNACAYLDTALQEQRSLELTQELRLGDGMPDIGQILWAEGQCLLRGKEWQRDSVSISGGVMVRVLYLPEDGSGVRCAEDWIPFRLEWDLPEGTPQGWLQLRCMPRSADARSISARKILLKTGVLVQAEALCQGEVMIPEPEEVAEQVQLLKRTWPLRLRKEAGEKAFQLDEETELPGSVPVPEKLLSSRIEPRLTECRVLGNKLVFRGNGDLRILYRSQEGQIYSWDFALPFSQFVQLEGEYGGDAQAELALCTTDLEAELTAEGRLRLKAGLTGQYQVTDKQLITTVEDAYCPGRELSTQTEELTLPVILENRRETLHPEQSIPADADILTDIIFRADLPRLRQTDDGWEIDGSGQFHALYYGSDGSLHSGTSRWEKKEMIPAGEDTRIFAAMVPAEGVRGTIGAGQILAAGDMPLEMTAVTRQKLPVVTGITMGAEVPKDPMRPSLILRRAGRQRLWDLAREAGTTVDSIRRANGLTEEPDPERMLLIPVP